MPTEPVNRTRLATVFTDVADSTYKIERQEEKVVALIRRDLAVIRELTARNQGNVAKKTGDGVLALFPSVDQALSFCEQLREYMRDNMTKLPPDEVVKHRMGIHWGEVIVAEEDAYGESVNLAARVTSVAPVGSIGISRAALDTLPKERIKGALSMGQMRLKGVSELTEVWEFPDPDRKHPLVKDYDARPGGQRGEGGGYDLPKRKVWPLVLALLAVAGGVGAGMYPKEVQGFLAEARTRAEQLLVYRPPTEAGPKNVVQDKPTEVVGKGGAAAQPKATAKQKEAAEPGTPTRAEVLAKRDEYFRDKDFGGFVQWLTSQPGDLAGRYSSLVVAANTLSEMVDLLPSIVARIPATDAVTAGGIRYYGDETGAVREQESQASPFVAADLSPSELGALIEGLRGRSEVSAPERARLDDQLKALRSSY